jgi:hypothetical protein
MPQFALIYSECKSGAVPSLRGPPWNGAPCPRLKTRTMVQQVATRKALSEETAERTRGRLSAGLIKRNLTNSTPGRNIGVNRGGYWSAS